MFNQQILDDYFKIVYEMEDIAKEDLKLLRKKVSSSTATYHGEPVPITYQPMLLPKKTVDDFRRISKILMSITRKVVSKFLEDEDYRKLFHFDSDLVDYILMDPAYSLPVPIARYDLFYNEADDFMLCELNTDGSSAMNEDNVLADLFFETEAMKKLSENYSIKSFDLFTPWVEKVISFYKENKKEDLKNVAIVDFIDKGTGTDFKVFKEKFEEKGVNCKIVDPRDIKYKDGSIYFEDFEIQLVYRRAVTRDLFERREEIREFLKGYKENAFLMLGSFRSQIMHSKLIFKVFRDPKTREILSEDENEFIEKRVPFTDIFDNKDAYYKVLENKDKYILKPFDGYASGGVVAGREHSQEEWEYILNDIFGSNYIYQEYFEQEKMDFLVLKNGEFVNVPQARVFGLFIYMEEFAGLYTRVGNEALISGAREYIVTPSFELSDK